MANITRNTFDKLKHYVGIRLQQGLPLLDADWNEEEDLSRDELRLFLKWFVGNGIPKDNDGFRILSPPAGNAKDFIIKGGVNNQPGCCLVDGWDLRIATDTLYSSQPLFNHDLALKYGVAPLTPLTPPASGQRTDLVYLDAWEREVDLDEDPEPIPGFINPAINIETCVRIKREWVVRVEQGASILPQAPEGHAYYTLANITRTAGSDVINQDGITDLRRTGMSMSAILDSYVGFVSAFATAEVPDGWLECNGQAVNRGDYPALFARIGSTFGAGDGKNTFNVPDLRGEFIRGWDHNRGIDPGRTFASYQLDQMQSHKHPDLGHTHATGGHTHGTSSHSHVDTGHTHRVNYAGYAGIYRGDYTSMSSGKGDAGNTYSCGSARANLSASSGSLSTGYETLNSANANIDNPIAATQGTARHGIETRARNVALLYCIKY